MLLGGFSAKYNTAMWWIYVVHIHTRTLHALKNTFQHFSTFKISKDKMHFSPCLNILWGKGLGIIGSLDRQTQWYLDNKEMKSCVCPHYMGLWDFQRVLLFLQADTDSKKKADLELHIHGQRRAPLIPKLRSNTFMLILPNVFNTFTRSWPPAHIWSVM